MRRRSTVVRARRAAHRTEVLLGDVRAIQTGRYGQRVANRVTGRLLSRLMRGLWR
jgi:hypothetical protein